MVECEAVCTRVCIMKLGQMVCLGNNQHLRSTHGTGFQLELNLYSSNTIESTKEFIMEHFPLSVLMEEHSTLLNYEIPRGSISKLSQAFKLLESKKEELSIIDYNLSQSTLEQVLFTLTPIYSMILTLILQVFLKHIRPNSKDMRDHEDDNTIHRVPHFSDYFTVYIMWFLALLIPGLHHFYLGNTLRGFKYLFTFNEVYAGWLLDLFELHVLLQRSVQEYGNVKAPFWCSCCNMLWFVLCCFGCCGLCTCCGHRCCPGCCGKHTIEENDEKEENKGEAQIFNAM